MGIILVSLVMIDFIVKDLEHLCGVIQRPVTPPSNAKI